MSSKPDIPSIAFGLGIMFILLALASIIVNTYFLTSVPAWQDGYFEAYKQFRQETLEQDVPRNIKLRFEIELLKEKIK